MNRKLTILGIRGVPAAHGGFETFAENLCHYLTHRGWQVTVYCQENGRGRVYEDLWQDIRRINIPIIRNGALGTIEFDWRSIAHLLKQSDPGLVLTLGYNTASFCARLRLAGITNLINMDGIEWRRDKWKNHERAWLWLNERFGCWLGNHLIADHPEIANHLATRIDRSKITMIPYGASEITYADAAVLNQFDLEVGKYITVIARPEPENSVLEIVKAFSRKRREYKLVMLGHYDVDNNAFHRQVIAAASPEVIFPGAIYEKSIVEALRFHARIYVHGHRVGGTNPSLVEALGASSAVLAHDNKFNRWVAGENAHYFSDENQCAKALELLLTDDSKVSRMRIASQERFRSTFTWDSVLKQYEALLQTWYPTAFEVAREADV